MRLNHETVRAVLLYLEDNLQLNDELDATNIQIPEVTTEEIVYTLIKLKEANFIEAIVSQDLSGDIDLFVNSITWSGHQFIDNIRDDKVWKKLIAYVNSKVDGASIITISKFATEFIVRILQSN